MNRGWYFAKCVLLALIAVLLLGLLTQYLWNWLVPSLFKGPEITYLQTMGLLLLTKILFWGFGGGKKHSYYNHQHGQQWKNRFSEKFSNMTPEEREAYKRKMKEKWCYWEKDTPEKDPNANV